MSSISAIIGQLFNARIAGSQKPGQPKHLTLYVGHIDPATGKPISSRVVFRAYVNDIAGKSHLFRFTQWGKGAYSACKGLSVGKEFSAVRLEPESYKGVVRVQMPNGEWQPVINPMDGQPLKTDKVGFVVRQLIYGNDAAKTIQMEIEMGIRPPHWNVPTHPDFQLWDTRRTERKALLFNPQLHSQEFGYARVVMPAAGLTPYIETMNATGGANAGAGAGANAGGYNPAAGAGGYNPAAGAGGYNPAGGTGYNPSMTGYAGATLPADVANAAGGAGTGAPRLF